MTQECLLDINAVTSGYDKSAVIHEISLSVMSGEFHGLIGLNGAGKTTLIKSVLGLKDIMSGDIQIAGMNISKKAAKKQVAYLPERFDPPWFLTGNEFVRFSLKLYGRKADQIEIDSYAERLNLDLSALKRRVGTYSKGMRQKLGLIATLMTGCKLLILDEPMSGLDPRARTLVKDLLLFQKTKYKQTVFLSSHILSDMDELCDRVSILHSGVIQFIGKPAELKAQVSTENLERAFLEFIDTDQNHAKVA